MPQLHRLPAFLLLTLITGLSTAFAQQEGVSVTPLPAPGEAEATPLATELLSPLPVAEAAVAAAEDVIWLLPGQSFPTRVVQVGVVAEQPEVLDPEALVAYPAYSAGSRVPLECTITSDSMYQGVIAQLRLVDAAGVHINSVQVEITLTRGGNICTFYLDAAGLRPGLYTAIVSVDYTNVDPPARYELPLRRVSHGNLAAEADAAAAQLAIIRQGLPAVAAAAPDSARPYEQMRLSLAEWFLDSARADLAARHLQHADFKLRYVEQTLETVRAALTFSSMRPELMGALPANDYARARPANGAWMVDDKPVFLAGMLVESGAAGWLPRLRSLGFNLAAFHVPPSPPAGPVREGLPTLGAVLPEIAEAHAAQMATMVDLAPVGSGERTEPGWPLAEEEPFVDLTLAHTRDHLLRHVEQGLTALKAQGGVQAVNVARLAKFKFRGDQVLETFLEEIRTAYPERSDLNEAWRAHLASYDEIRLWALRPDDPASGVSAEFDPLSSYQKRRPFVYDWQTFHRGLISDWFAHLRGVAAAAHAEVPIMAALGADDFVEEETRFGADRETVNRMMEVSATTVELQLHDEHFAYTYPRQSAEYSLLRSYSPTHPVVNLRNDIRLDVVRDADTYFHFLHAALWEGAMTGLNASAVPAGSMVWQHPRALEGYATAAIDLNRLSPIVHAMQQAPVEVGVLLSESSKILDGGKPHLASALFAYEGCSFSGYHVGFITEDQIAEDGIDHLRVLVIPETPAVRNETFAKLVEFSNAGGTIARVGTPIPYDEYGMSRRGMLRNTGKTVLVRGMNLPTEYLHGIDAAVTLGALPQIPRAINANHYPLEGVRTRYVVHEGVPYLYLINLRKDPVECHLVGNIQSGRDLIQGRDVTFPRVVPPMEPMLIRMLSETNEATLVAIN